MQNLHQKFVLCSSGQIYGRDFAKFCGLLRLYELYDKRKVKISQSFEAFSEYMNFKEILYSKKKTLQLCLILFVVSLHLCGRKYFPIACTNCPGASFTVQYFMTKEHVCAKKGNNKWQFSHC